VRVASSEDGLKMKHAAALPEEDDSRASSLYVTALRTSLRTLLEEYVDMHASRRRHPRRRGVMKKEWMLEWSKVT
jgi:hypothetical protein